MRKKEEDRSFDTSSTVVNMERDSTDHEVAFIQAGLKKFLNEEEEKYVTEDSTLRDLSSEDAGQNDEVHSEKECDERAKQNNFTLSSSYCSYIRPGISFRVMVLSLMRVERPFTTSNALRLEKVDSMNQTSVLDHF